MALNLPVAYLVHYLFPMNTKCISRCNRRLNYPLFLAMLKLLTVFLARITTNLGILNIVLAMLLAMLSNVQNTQLIHSYTAYFTNNVFKKNI